MGQTLRTLSVTRCHAYSVDTGTTNITSPAWDTAAVCLSLWLASDLPFSSDFNQLMPPDIRQFRIVKIDCIDMLCFFHGSRHLTELASYQIGMYIVSLARGHHYGN